MAPKETIGSVLVDKMHELEEEYRGILEARSANRRTLRDLDAQGLLTEEEAAQVAETYPERKRNEENEEAAQAA